MRGIGGDHRGIQDIRAEALNLVAPAFIEFAEDGSGSFGFIAVQGQMDCREVERDGRPGMEFSRGGKR